MCRVWSGRHAAAIAVLACLLVAASGCRSTGPLPHDAADARYSLEVSLGSAWGYPEEQAGVRLYLTCSSVRTGRSMYLADEPHVVTCTFTPHEGQPLVFRDKTRANQHWLALPPEADGTTAVFAPGTYQVSASATLPSGEIVNASYGRQYEVRPRELELTLTADADVYRQGDTITLVGVVKNVFDRDFAFPHAGRVRIVLDAGGDRMDVEDADIPAVLGPGQEHRLFELAFTAGEWDRRFTAGLRSEWYPPPFGRAGEYRMVLTMSVLPVGEEAPARPGRRRPWIEALPGRTVLRVE